MTDFTSQDYWRAIILYGLNAATYKMALANCLLKFAERGTSQVNWGQLAQEFYSQYKLRISANPMPQQATPGRLTKLERVVRDELTGLISETEAIERVALEGFNDVVPRFQTIGRDAHLAAGRFYEFDFGKRLTLKNDLMEIGEVSSEELRKEIEARWSLLEGAFSINQSQQQYQLANSIRDIYLLNGEERRPLTKNIPFLTGYQGNVCFYCGEDLGNDIHVDHVLPRQIINHDEVWNLVLSHGHCNLQKSDKLVGNHFILKLIARNENIMGSNHPWKRKIEVALGSSLKFRTQSLLEHYDRVKLARGLDFWGGSPGYNPETDPFYRRLVTVLNNT